jgi:hypothetical protein
MQNESSVEAPSARLDALADQIANKAHGVFIWARVVVKEIASRLPSCTPFFQIQEALDHMPKELKDLYEHTLSRIEPRHAEEAYVMLQIAICALSPLPLFTFLNTTSYTLWLKYSAQGEESQKDMIRRVVSRSGGLLEVVETDLGTSVQFIHQTVKEYIHERKDNLGLQRLGTGGNGYEYLFSSAVECWETWAKDIGLDLFEYATHARLADTHEEILTGSLLSLLRTDENNVTRLDWWLQQKEHEPQIRFYTHELFLALNGQQNKPEFQLFCLGFVAGFGLSSLLHVLLPPVQRYEGNSVTSRPDAKRIVNVLLCIATIGPKITDIHLPRKEMLKSLLNPHSSLAIPLEEFTCFFPRRVLQNRVNMRFETEVEPNPLVLLILSKGLYDQDETERISAMQFLLEHNWSPNIRILHRSPNIRTLNRPPR